MNHSRVLSLFRKISLRGVCLRFHFIRQNYIFTSAARCRVVKKTRVYPPDRDQKRTQSIIPNCSLELPEQHGMISAHFSPSVDTASLKCPSSLSLPVLPPTPLVPPAVPSLAQPACLSQITLTASHMLLFFFFNTPQAFSCPSHISLLLKKILIPPAPACFSLILSDPEGHCYRGVRMHVFT